MKLTPISTDGLISSSQNSENSLHSLEEASPKAMSLLDEVLDGKSPEFQLKVLKWAYKTGVSEDDILFLFMVGIGQLELILEESPKDLSNLFDSWSGMLFDRLKEAERIAVKSQQTAIASAVSDLIKKTEVKKEKTNNRPKLTLIGAILVSLLGGLLFPYRLLGNNSYANSSLTTAQIEDLKWVTSKEGVFARNLIEWNSIGLKNLKCLNEAKKLPITLKVEGQESTSGYCVLWVVPSKKRVFRE